MIESVLLAAAILAVIACVVLCTRAASAARNSAASVDQLARASQYDGEIDESASSPAATHAGRHIAHDRPYLSDPASGVSLHVCVVDGCKTRLRRKQ